MFSFLARIADSKAAPTSEAPSFALSFEIVSKLESGSFIVAPQFDQQVGSRKGWFNNPQKKFGSSSLSSAIEAEATFLLASGLTIFRMLKLHSLRITDTFTEHPLTTLDIRNCDRAFLPTSLILDGGDAGVTISKVNTHSITNEASCFESVCTANTLMGIVVPSAFGELISVWNAISDGDRCNIICLLRNKTHLNYWAIS